MNNFFTSTPNDNIILGAKPACSLTNEAHPQNTASAPQNFSLLCHFAMNTNSIALFWPSSSWNRRHRAATTAIPISVLLASSWRPHDLTAQSLILVLHTHGYTLAKPVTYFSFTAGCTSLGIQTLLVLPLKTACETEKLGIFSVQRKRKMYFKASNKAAIPNAKRKGSWKKTAYHLLHF